MDSWFFLIPHILLLTTYCRGFLSAIRQFGISNPKSDVTNPNITPPPLGDTPG